MLHLLDCDNLISSYCLNYDYTSKTTINERFQKVNSYCIWTCFDTLMKSSKMAPIYISASLLFIFFCVIGCKKIPQLAWAVPQQKTILCYGMLWYLGNICEVLKIADSLMFSGHICFSSTIFKRWLEVQNSLGYWEMVF